MLNDNNVLNIKCRGRITSLWKEQVRTDYLVQGISQNKQPLIEQMNNVRGSNGTYRVLGDYLGTALYVNVTVYDPPVFTFGDHQYQIPSHFQIECYEATRQAINEKVFGKLSITENRLAELKEQMVGKKSDIVFTLLNQPDNDGYLKVIATLLLCKVNDIIPFYGIIYAMKISEK